MGSNAKLEGDQISISHADIGCFSKSTYIPLVATYPYARSVSEKLTRSYLSHDDELLGSQHTQRAKLVLNAGLRFNFEDPAISIVKSSIRQRRQQYKDRRNIERDDKRKKLEIDQERKKKLLEFNRTLMNHREEFIRFHKNKKMEVARAAKAVKTHFDLIEYRKEKDETNAEAKRIKALKENDMEGYLKLVQETKNDRLHFLINQTDSFILKIQHMMEGQRGDNSNANTFSDGRTDEVEMTNDEDGKGGTKVMKQYYNTAHSKFEKVCQPSILKGGDLKEYQLSGLQWLVSLYNNNLNGILADEMGLGKTIQTIALLAYIMEVKKVNGPFLIVVPLSTLSNWVNEASKWCPDIIKVVYKGTPNERKKIFKEEIEARQFNLLLTTYEYIMKDKSMLKKIEWVYIIVDEGHRMKNANSKFAQTLGLVYRSKNRILLTGTPLQNNLPELWALLNFLLPSVFSSLDSFDEWFNKPFASFRTTNNNMNTNEDASLSQEERLLIVHRLHEVLRPFMLRRIKDQVLDQLPEKVEKVIKCDLSGWQKTLYRAIQQKSTDLQSGEGGSTFNNAIMQLRKVCNHPYLFLSEWNIDDFITRSSGKFDLLNRMLPKLKRAGHRVLMFSQMTQLMTILERYFDMKGYKYLRLDGSTNSEERERTMFMFNDPNSPHFIFLLSTRAGGLGLNLASADTVILFDSDWNPMMDAQAQDRAHRIGQKNEVRVFRFITNSPVEERILARATDKKNLNSLVVEAGQFNRGQDKKVEDEDANKEMMEVLLKEYSAGGINIPSNAGIDEEDEDEKEYEEKENDNNDDINMMMAINESELALYQEMDRQKEIQDYPLLGIDEVPSWLTLNHWHSKHNALVHILNNTKPSNSNNAPIEDQNAGRKRKDVLYDDKLTEKQFMRQMDKKIKDEEQDRKPNQAVVKKEVKVVKEDNADLSDELAGTFSINIIILNSHYYYYYY